MNRLEGILPAVVTPRNEKARFCPGAFELLLDSLYTAGVHGIYVCGNTGEGLLLPSAERIRVAEAAVRCSPPGKLVIVHAGSHDVDEAVSLARHAERIGACAISSLPPLGVSGADEVSAYYQKLIAATGLPFLLYYFPDICPAIAKGDLVFELLGLPNVAGLKFTDYDLYKLWLLRKSGAVVFNGRDEVLAAGLLMGVHGAIGSFYNLAPELFLQVYELGRQGRWEEARSIQARINELVEIGLRFPLIPAIKKMLAWSSLDCGGCVSTQRPLSPAEETLLRALLTEAGFFQLAGQ